MLFISMKSVLEVNMIENFSDLIYPNDPNVLIEAFSKHKRLLLRTERRAQYQRLLPWDRINSLITANRFASGSMELAQNSAILPVEMSIQRPRNEGQKSILKTSAVQENCRKGLSLVINNINEMVRDIALMNAVVERELRCPVHTNAYISFNKGSAFKAHWDEQNVLILQTHGRKLWKCWGPKWPFPVNASEHPTPTDLGPPEWEGILEPGDVLYVPRGDIHQAQVIQGEDSVHLTITISPPRVAALARALAQTCESEPVARRDLPTVASAEEKAAWMAEIKALLHRAVDALDLEQALANLDRAREPLDCTSLGRTARMTGATRFQPALRRRLPMGQAGDHDEILRAGSRKWKLGPVEREIMRCAFRHDTLSLKDLAALMPDRAQDVTAQAVADLTVKGLLVLLGED